jgi:hypothetical protein
MSLQIAMARAYKWALSQLGWAHRASRHCAKMHLTQEQGIFAPLAHPGRLVVHRGADELLALNLPRAIVWHGFLQVFASAVEIHGPLGFLT